MSQQMRELHQGGCLCGSVRLQTLGRPLKVLVCHCTMCQRATGSAFSVEPIFPKGRVQLTGEPPSLYEHRSPEHGRVIQFSFCGKCGNRIGITLERFPDIQVVYGGVFDDPSWLKPDCHIFTESAAPWTQLPSDVECFSRHMLEPDGSPAKPRA
jgi:hypothetical protein